jgi:hypothetical protein
VAMALCDASVPVRRVGCEIDRSLEAPHQSAGLVWGDIRAALHLEPDVPDGGRWFGSGGLRRGRAVLRRASWGRPRYCSPRIVGC